MTRLERGKIQPSISTFTTIFPSSQGPHFSPFSNHDKFIHNQMSELSYDAYNGGGHRLLSFSVTLTHHKSYEKDTIQSAVGLLRLYSHISH